MQRILDVVNFEFDTEPNLCTYFVCRSLTFCLLYIILKLRTLARTMLAAVYHKYVRLHLRKSF